MPKFKYMRKRFWSKVDIREKDDCWEWLASKNPDGYGRFWINNRLEQAHRVSWSFFKGDIPEGMKLLHHCDNPGCCNPSHLFIGTQQDNADDREAKGRGNQSIGEKNGNSKLIAKDVLKIRAIYSDGLASQRKLAEMFSISKSMIGYILSRSNWKHI